MLMLWGIRVRNDECVFGSCSRCALGVFVG